MDGLKTPTTHKKSLFQATSVTECYNITISHVFTRVKIHFYISLHLEWVCTTYLHFWGLHEAHQHWRRYRNLTSLVMHVSCSMSTLCSPDHCRSINPKYCLCSDGNGVCAICFFMPSVNLIPPRTRLVLSSGLKKTFFVPLGHSLV